MRRPLTLILALTVLAVEPASASAAIAIFQNRQAEVGTSLYAQSYGGPTSTRLVVERAGSAVVDVRSASNYVGQPNFVAQAGDVIKVYQPADAAAPAATHTEDGTPTIDRVCAGTTRFTGRQTGGNGYISSAGVTSPFSTRSGGGNPGVVSKTALDAYAVQLRFPVALGQVAFVVQRFFAEGLAVQTSVSRAVENCPPPAPPVVVAAPRPDDGRVLFDSRRDVKALAGGTGVRVTVGCAPLSAIPCAGAATLTTGSKKATRIVGSKRFTIAPGKTKRVTVKLSKSALRTLKRKKRLTVRLIVATVNQAGDVLSRSTTVRLKAKRPKKRQS